MVPGILSSSLFRRGIYSTSGGGDDASFANVVLLAHCDNPASTVITDSSPLAANLTAAGTDLQSGTDFKFGTGSLIGTGSNLVASRADAASNLGFGTGSFTIEFWFKRNGAISQGTILRKYLAATGYRSWRIESGSTLGGTDRMAFRWSHDGTVSQNIVPDSPLPLGEWTHVAITGDGTTMRMFFGGVMVASDGTNYGCFENSSDFNIFMSSTSDSAMDEIRITKGVCRYTAPFTPPDAPFPNS